MNNISQEKYEEYIKNLGEKEKDYVRKIVENMGFIRTEE